MQNRESNHWTHNFIQLIKDIGHNEDVVVTTGEVTEEAPLAVYLSRYDVTLTGDSLSVNATLLEHEEDAKAHFGGETHDVTLYRPNQLTVGTDVLVLFDVKNETSYVVSRVVSLPD